MICYRKEHHVNSLFVNSHTLSPATNNLVAMTKFRTDRTAFHPDMADILITTDQQCRAGPDTEENMFSSLPLRDYNQMHCQRKMLMKKFSMMFNCSILPLYGTLDKVEGGPLPVCGRKIMQMMMYMMRSMPMDTPKCPMACVEEHVETHQSFTLLSDNSVKRVGNLWKLPGNMSKEDCVGLELYYKTLTTQVTTFKPLAILDLISYIGGTLGLFVGGSLFSIIETLAIFILIIFSVVKTILFLCNSQSNVE